MSLPPATGRGQSSPIGFVLVVALVVGAVVATVAFGAAALTDAQGESAVARAEQTMTLFDSRTAQVALGDSSIHTVDLGGTQGTYQVDPAAGSMSIVQLDCDDDGVNDDGNDDVDGGTGDDDAYLMAPVDLGRMTYTSGSTTLAYQGGGVWRKGEGEARMVSPPEFHYRDATLTLPVVLARGSGAGSGAGTRARVTDGGDPTAVFPRSGSFPDRCDQTADGEDEPYANPVADGRVFVRVESEYARAWGEYFETRTEGIVTYPDDDVVRVELVSLAQLGTFEMPGEGGSVPVSGAAGEHAVEEFSITLRPDDTDSANFNNLQWSMYAESGDQQLEIHLRKSGSGGCSSGTTGITADANVYYSEDGGDTYHGWHADDAFDAECADLDGDGDDEIYMDVEFVDDEDDDGDVTEVESDDPELTYVDGSGLDNLVYFKVKGGDTVVDPVTLGGHSVSWEPTTYEPNDGDTESIDRLVRHYFAEFPEEFDLTVDDKNSDTINEAGSSGRLFTGGSGRYVTYLHVTQNEVVVEID
jgi:hypothetical protein